VKQITDEVLASLAALEHHHDFKTILDWIEANAHDRVQACMTETDVDVYRAQGAARELTELVETARQARQHIHDRQS